jgi:hypothetical protein
MGEFKEDERSMIKVQYFITYIILLLLTANILQRHV